MNLSPGALKIIGGVGAASATAVATGVGIDQNNKNIQRQKVLAEQAIIEGIKKSEVGQNNWFGGGLHEFLEDQDIVFEVWNKNNSKKLTKDDLYVRKSPNNNLSIEVKVLVSKDSNQLKTSKTGKVKIEHLKELHEGKDWTWSCIVRFSASSITSTDKSQKYELKDKDKFLNGNNGLFDVLRKDLTGVNEGEKTKWKNTKKNFVKNCSDFARREGKSENVLDLKPTRITFALKPVSASGENKVQFTNVTGKEDAKKWFGNEITVTESAN